MKNISEQFWGPNKHVFAFGPQIAIVQALGSLFPSTLDPHKVQWEKSNYRVALFSVGGAGPQGKTQINHTDMLRW